MDDETPTQEGLRVERVWRRIAGFFLHRSKSLCFSPPDPTLNPEPKSLNLEPSTPKPPNP